MSLEQYGISQEFGGLGDWPPTAEGAAPVKPKKSFIGIPDLHINPLQQYTNVTYNTRLTMMPAREMAEPKAPRSYDYKNGIIMWETGGSGTIYLEEMEIEMAGVGNNSDDYKTASLAKVKGRLVEPIGGRLIESIAISSQLMEYESNNASIYLLEVYFTGYDKSDLPIICKGWNGEDQIYRWYVSLNELNMSLDYKGAVYDFKMTDAGAEASSPDAMLFESSFKMDSSKPTVGGFCDELAKALNDREDDKVKSGLREFPSRYVITPHKEIALCKFNKLGPVSRAWQWVFGGEKTAPAHTSITQFIDDTLSQSSDLLKMLHRVNDGKREYNSTDTKPKSLGKISRVLGYANGAVAIKGTNGLPQWDEKLNGYVYEYHYFVHMLSEARIILPGELKDTEDPNERRSRVDAWISEGLLRKAYKWIYTGENAEVLTCSLKLNNLFRHVRPLWISSETNKAISAGATQPTAREKSGNTGKNPNKLNYAKMLNTLHTATTGNQAYAEDLLVRTGQQANININPTSGWRPLHTAKMYNMNTEVHQSFASTPFFQESATEFSIYKQINAAAGHGDNSSATIELEVVGDPYYLMQIPGGKNQPPWECDVWEWEKNHCTREMLAEKRKTAGTYDILPKIYFEAQIPSSGWTAEDIMELRKSDAISGIYHIIYITNKFSKGKFTSYLKANRDMLANDLTGANDSRQAPSATGTANTTGKNNAAPASNPAPNK